jgi:hypothetical protein
VRQRWRRLYEALFKAASAMLIQFAASDRHLGGEAAFTLVLHSWRQDLARKRPPGLVQRGLSAAMTVCIHIARLQRRINAFRQAPECVA